jgi:D-xylose 1-dehydrogenase (NADP+, D-xylono-1,5-lactone-forming)
MTTKIRWGILGVAHINERLLPAFARAANAELRGIASRSLDKARTAARAAGIPLAFGSYQDLLDDPTIDAVYNPLPNNLHAEWTRRAIEHGKHVLCEKPLTPTADEAAELVAWCKLRKLCLMDGFMWPHHPRTARLEQLLNQGTIGAIRRVNGVFTFRMAPLDPANIRLQPEMAGGSLLDVGCYPVYGIRWAFQEEPVSVWAQARYKHGVDVEMCGILRFDDGRSASFDCGFTQPQRQWLEIVGDKGTVFVPDMWLPSPRAEYEVHMDGSSDTAVTSVGGHDQIQHMIENFGRFVLEGKPVTPSPDEAVKTLRVLDALARSARENREVAVYSSRSA